MANTTGQKFGGRTKGTANKSTTLAREAIAKFVDGNAHKLEEWLDKVAEDNPAEAFKLYQSVVEYHIPKLARTDTTVTGADGGPVQHSIQVKFGD
jgi:hypothetical protein